ncbi:zymogen granule membrane protein 16-like [Lacerta agilis]|uniref:zymogen granule membrane protein 16-like n=1 Tax=Lacerta agilis TaxID=80427 RepID=UPI00141A1E51|nr:zymogen granule membrane protein 16-like [Lacerta agilis]
MPVFILLSLLLLRDVVSGSPAQASSSSYSGEYGGSSGEHFDQSSNQLDGPITALRIQANNKYILSIQVRYGGLWSRIEGNPSGSQSVMPLFPGEGIVQVLGRFGSFVEYIAFRTNLGRVFDYGAGSGLGVPFDAEPLFPNTVLRYISGRSGPLVSAVGFHWDKEGGIGGWDQSTGSPHTKNNSP